MKYQIIKKTLSIALLLIVTLFSHAGNLTGFMTDTESFKELRDKRSKLLIEVQKLKEKIESKEASHSINNDNALDTIYLKDDIERIDLLLKKRQGDPDLIAKRKILSSRLSFTIASINQNIDLEKEIEKLKKELQDKQDELNTVEYSIDKVLNTERSRMVFMDLVCLMFCILIGMLIVLFFNVTSKDPSVIRVIFSSDSGIQFVTLFSIVIAIIIFGITGILEGKELSALLGSLSGYILGKVTINSVSKDPQIKPNLSLPMINDNDKK